MTVLGQHCISKNFNVNLSYSLIKTTIKYKISLINFTEVHNKNFLNVVPEDNSFYIEMLLLLKYFFENEARGCEQN